MEYSGYPWEHRRVPFAIGTRHRRMEAEGWTQVGPGSFPWAYYKRPLRQDGRGEGTERDQNS
ncbi:hypothetical protein ACFQ2B_06350 [Streptomyces stramineus]